jgi:hypothetical protein
VVIYFVLTVNKPVFETSTWFLWDFYWSKLHKLQFTLTVLSMVWKLESLLTHRNFVDCTEMLKECARCKSDFCSLQRNGSESR